MNNTKDENDYSGHIESEITQEKNDFSKFDRDINEMIPKGMLEDNPGTIPKEYLSEYDENTNDESLDVNKFSVSESLNLFDSFGDHGYLKPETRKYSHQELGLNNIKLYPECKDFIDQAGMMPYNKGLNSSEKISHELSEKNEKQLYGYEQAFYYGGKTPQTRLGSQGGIELGGNLGKMSGQQQAPQLKQVHFQKKPSPFNVSSHGSEKEYENFEHRNNRIVQLNKPKEGNQQLKKGVNSEMTNMNGMNNLTISEFNTKLSMGSNGSTSTNNTTGANGTGSAGMYMNPHSLNQGFGMKNGIFQGQVQAQGTLGTHGTQGIQSVQGIQGAQVTQGQVGFNHPIRTNTFSYSNNTNPYFNNFRINSNPYYNKIPLNSLNNVNNTNNLIFFNNTEMMHQSTKFSSNLNPSSSTNVNSNDVSINNTFNDNPKPKKKNFTDFYKDSKSKLSPDNQSIAKKKAVDDTNNLMSFLNGINEDLIDYVRTQKGSR